MSAWITDRVPTNADSDLNSCVFATNSKGLVSMTHFGNIILGDAWQPITYPEPYVKPKVYVIGEGGLYKNGFPVYSWRELTEKQWEAMTDALNRLEDGV